MTATPTHSQVTRTMTRTRERADWAATMVVRAAEKMVERMASESMTRAEAADATHAEMVAFFTRDENRRREVEAVARWTVHEAEAAVAAAERNF